MTYKFFLDTNILVDIFSQRDAEFPNSGNFYYEALKNQNPMFTSTACVSTLLYLLRKDDLLKQKSIMGVIAEDCQLIDANETVLKNVVKSKFKDLEDALLYHIAAFHQIDYLVTRNSQDFIREGFTQIISPEEALKLAQTEH